MVNYTFTLCGFAKELDLLEGKKIVISSSQSNIRDLLYFLYTISQVCLNTYMYVVSYPKEESLDMGKPHTFTFFAHMTC